MPIEIYHKPQFGTRIRKITVAEAVARSLVKITNNIWSSRAKDGFVEYGPPPTASVTGLPATGDSGGTASATISVQTPQPTDRAYTARVSYQIGGSASSFTVPIAKGSSAAQIATALAGASWPSGVTAGPLGASVVLTPSNGVVINTLSVTFQP
jgi:hypothetical protein